MTMIVGRVGDKTQPMTLILHPDIETDIFRLEVEGEMHFDETEITQCLCSNCLFIESTTTMKDRLDLHSTMSSPRTGVLSLIRFNSGQDKDLLD